jgi:hypothetical protein
MWNLFNPWNHIRWFAKRSGSWPLGGWVRRKAALERIIQNLQGWDIYVSMNPSKSLRGIRVRASEISHWSTILIDIDPISEGANPLAAAGVVTTELRVLLQDSALSPMVVDSGRGVQLWLHLQPLALDDTLRPRARAAVGELLRRLSTPSHGCIVDTSTADLARVGRMPETLNSKTGRRAVILDSGGDPVATSAVLALAPSTTYEAPPTTTTNWQQALPWLSLTATDYLTLGTVEPGRHKAAYAAAAALRDAGMLLGDVEALVLNGAQKCSPPLREHDALRAARCAFDAAHRESQRINI